MRLLGTSLLTALIEREAQLNPKQGTTLRSEINLWKKVIKVAYWNNSADVKQTFGTASPIGNNRIVFNICENKYRLVLKFNYAPGVCRVKFAGTHGEYDEILDIKNI